MNHQYILKTIEDLLSHHNNNFSQKLYDVCELLQNKISHYDWVGFYFAEHSTKTLHLGPFAGEPTDHKVIPFGKGICGQVANSNQTFLVKDVNAQDNYIACSINVKSEIVVPLFVEGTNVGQIDIDSHTKNAFTEDDEKLLSQINQLVEGIILTQKVDLKTVSI